MPLFSHQTRGQWRYTSTHLMWQWRALGKLKQLVLCATVTFIVYAIVKIYSGTQQISQTIPVESLFKKVDRPMCRIDEKELASAERHRTAHENENVFSKEDLMHSYAFNLERDTMVFLHIQKTSGENLMRFITDVTPAVTALWSRDPTVQNAEICSLHMDYTTLQQCVRESTSLGRQKRPLVVTMLRDPLTRYISEWEHVHSGDTWHVSHTHCTCPPCEADSVPRCLLDARLDSDFANSEKALMQKMVKNRPKQEADSYKAVILFQRWQTQSLDDFITCFENPANNRQVRMLGDYDVISEDCNELRSFSHLEIAEKLLESAKKNLREMAFFGLYEYQIETQDLFQKTFGIPKLGDVYLSQNKQNHASCLHTEESTLEAIRDMNYVDYELYRYARDLFFQRLKAAGIK